MIPPVAIVTAWFVMFQAVGLLATYPGLILAHVTINLPMGLWLMSAFIREVPRELEEAAAIDGASRWQSIRQITLPLLGPTIRVSIFLSIIGSLQLFDLIWVTTRGGPVNASNTMATYMFDQGFVRFQFGYGSAVAVVLFLICFALALAYQRWVLRRDTEGATTYG
jgi:raffinose/stachyose/melibiose transport system permease protein